MEGGEWRMVPAPSSLQPRREDEREPEPTTSAPATSMPYFPWEKGIDG
jgi:hypothetical protein